MPRLHDVGMPTRRAAPLVSRPGLAPWNPAMLMKASHRERVWPRAGLAQQRFGAPGHPDAGGVFRGLNPEEVEVLFAGCPDKKCPAGKVLFTPHDPGGRLFVLKEGRVDLYRLTPSGKRLVTRRIRPGSVFGVMGLLGQRTQGNFAETVDESLVRVTTTEQVTRLLKSDPDFALGILQLVGNRLNELEERFVQIAYSPVSARLAHLLLANMDPATGVVDGLTHAEIGDTIGALRQTVTETLASFKRRGLVTTGCRRICILDGPRLKSLTVTVERQ